jgi:O-antigen/teichoic acid export membrane protein
VSETQKKPAGETADAAVVAGRGALFIGFAKIYFMITGAVQQFVLPNKLSQADFGAFAVVNSVISIINNTMIQATLQSVSRFTAENDARAGAVQRAGLRIQAVFATLVAIALFIGAPLISSLLRAPQYATYFRIAAAIPFFYGFYAVFVGTANGLRRFRDQATFDVGFSTLKTILMLGAAVVWHVAGAFAGFATAAVLILLFAGRRMRLPAAGEQIPSKQLVPYMAAIGVYALLLNLALNYDVSLLQYFAAHKDAAGAPAIVASYQTLRTLALLPYQALIVITFVIFPLVSRSTFAEDKDATRAYVTQTLRYALLFAGAMGLVLGARPGALLAILYKNPAYGAGAPALPILVAGECTLALLGVACAILNAAGRTRATLSFMAITVVVGAGAAAILIPSAEPGPAMLIAAASATSLGMAAGFLSSLVYLRTRLGGGLPLATVARVAAAAGAAVVIARFLPAHGKIMGLAAIAAVGIVYAVVLIALGEFGAEDKAKVRRILRRG